MTDDNDLFNFILSNSCVSFDLLLRYIFNTLLSDGIMNTRANI